MRGEARRRQLGAHRSAGESLVRSFRAEIRDSGLEIRGSGFRIRDSRFEIRDAGFETIRDSRFEIRDSGVETGKEEKRGEATAIGRAPFSKSIVRSFVLN